MWVDERTQVIEAIGCDQSGRDQFPESGLNLCLEFSGTAHNVGEEVGLPGRVPGWIAKAKELTAETE